MTSPSRQFWILTGDVTPDVVSHENPGKYAHQYIHVIEYSAFLALQQQADKLAEALENAKDILEFVGGKDVFAGFRILFRDMAGEGAANASHKIAAYKAYKGET